MATTIKAPRKKKAVQRRPKTGLSAVPLDMPYRRYTQIFNLEIEPRESAKIIKTSAKRMFSKTKAQQIAAVEDWKLAKPHVAAYCHWVLSDKDAPAETVEWMTTWFDSIAEQGAAILKTKKKEEKQQANVYKPNIQERMAEQLREIIGQFEEWLDEQPSKDIPKMFEWLKKQNVAQAHIKKIREYYEPIRAEFEALAEKKVDAELAEGYSYLSKIKINQYRRFFDQLMADLDAFENAKKATRKTRVKKAPSKEKLIAKVKYKTEDTKYKITSVAPVKILDSTEVWLFNTKTRKLIQVIAEENQTLSIKGTTLQFFDANKTVMKTLRKPEQQIAEFQKAGKVKLRKFMSEIKAVEAKFNGRINADMVILKAS